MTRSRSLTVEQLEERALLSSVSDRVMPGGEIAQFPVSNPGVSLWVAPPASSHPDLTYSLTTDKSVYQVGEPIQITLTETNNTEEPITVYQGPSLDGFAIQQDNVTVWRSDAGLCCIALWIGSDTLQPGQSLTRTATWDGIPNVVPPSILSGSFTVTADGASAAIEIASPPAAQVATTLTTDKPVYRAGEPIQMTFTETNTGDQPTTILVGGSFDVKQDGRDVWSSESPGWVVDPFGLIDSYPAIRPDFAPVGLVPTISFAPCGQGFHWETLQPGQSYTDTTIWYGIPRGGLFVQSGTFVVSHAGDPQPSTTTFQLINPITFSMTTDKPIYHVGEPVQITLTETNTGDQPVLIDPNLPSASITHDANWIWGDSSWSSEPTTVILQPGQSYSKTVTWNGIAADYPLNPSGTFVVSLDGTSEQATFQVADPHLVYSLTTDKANYHAGEPVRITFTETNAGDQPVTVDTNMLELTITHDGIWVWANYPAWFCNEATITLQPGQSYSKSVTWDDIATDYPFNHSGTFVVSLDGTSQQTTFQVAAPSLVYSLTTDQPVYHLGEPVQITFTETNTGDQPVTIDPDLLAFNITHDENWIWGNDPFGCWDLTTVTIQPGQSYSRTVTWDGIPNELPYDSTLNPSGTFVVTVVGTSQMTTFQVADPHLAYSLTTDKTSYQVGEPVRITFTETNAGDQPVTIGLYLVMFNLLDDGNWVWGDFSAWRRDQPVITLQPGQSYSRTVTWNGTPSCNSVNPWGTFVVSVAGTNQQATFQVAAPSLVYSLTTDKPVYQVGEKVRITLTETNTGDQPVTIDSELLGFQITLDGFQLWWSPSTWRECRTAVTLQRGESYSRTVTWDGDTESIWQGVPPGALGTAVVSVEWISQQATFQIVAPSDPSTASTGVASGPSRGISTAPPAHDPAHQPNEWESLGPPPSVTSTATTARAAENAAQTVLGPVPAGESRVDPEAASRSHRRLAAVTVWEGATWPWRSTRRDMAWEVRQARRTSILLNGSEG